MKKAIICVSLVIGLYSFTRAISIEEVINESAQMVKQDPSGTVYGVTGKVGSTYVVSTPLGKLDIKQEADGAYSCLGMRAKIESRKGSKYTVSTSIGDFDIDTKKCTATKR